MAEVHKTINPEKLVCLICNKTFVTKEVLTAHNMAIHDISAAPTGQIKD
jgi:glucose-6-phosphate isomerase